MKRNKSVDDVFSSGFYEDEEFFNQMGSRSLSLSRENVILFIVIGVDFFIFDLFFVIRSKFFDFGGSVNKFVFLDLFDFFSFKILSKKLFNEFDFFVGKLVDSKIEIFDLFGGKLVQGSSSIEIF